MTIRGCKPPNNPGVSFCGRVGAAERKRSQRQNADLKEKNDTSCSRKQSFANSAVFPRWMLAAGVLVIGFMHLLGGLSDGSGKLMMPGTRSVLYMSAVIGIAVFLVYAGRSRWSGDVAKNTRTYESRQWTRLWLFDIGTLQMILRRPLAGSIESRRQQ